MKEKIKNIFKKKFSDSPLLFHSPGRINIIGEHTDYNEGFVLPAAIDKHIYVAISKRTDKAVNLFACDFNESFETDIENIKPASIQWPNYILGVVDQLQRSGHDLQVGFNMVLDGDIPIGAGLSSSAAVESAVIFALNDIFELGLTRIQMVPLAQKAEHEFAGVKCGIMDQFASMFGKKDHAIMLDCRSLDFEYVPLDLKGYSILLFNSNVKHNLASSAYNERRVQCETGAALVKAHHPEVRSLRDVTMQMLDQYVAPANQLVYRRCRYVVEENERLLAACEDLRHGNMEALGKKMFATHEGLSRDYEVSCRELDFLVDHVKQHPEVAGARMMGGGFGGCTINLVKNGFADLLEKEISEAYELAMHKPLTTYRVSIGNGTQKNS